MHDFLQISTTVPTEQLALKIAESLVASSLAACVQVLGPVQSTYRWQGKIETAYEWVCTAKSNRRLFSEIEKRICQLHEYECPEIFATSIVAGSKSYLEWLERETDYEG